MWLCFSISSTESISGLVRQWKKMPLSLISEIFHEEQFSWLFGIGIEDMQYIA